MANDGRFNPPPQDAVQGAATPDTQGFINPFEIPSREGFVDFIRAGIKARKGNASHRYNVDVLSPYGSEIATTMVSGLYAGDGLLGGLDGIVDVYYTKVAQADRPLLQQAAGDVLLDLVNDPGGVNDQDFRTVKQMIFLMGRIRATEAPEALADAVNGTSLSEEQRIKVFSLSMSALASLPMEGKPTPKVFTAVSKLIDSSYFDERSLFNRTEILIYSNPSRLGEILDKYSTRLTGLLHEWEQAGENKDLTRDGWLEAVMSAEPSPQILEKARAIVSG